MTDSKPDTKMKPPQKPPGPRKEIGRLTTDQVAKRDYLTRA